MFRYWNKMVKYVRFLVKLNFIVWFLFVDSRNGVYMWEGLNFGIIKLKSGFFEIEMLLVMCKYLSVIWVFFVMYLKVLSVYVCILGNWLYIFD